LETGGIGAQSGFPVLPAVEDAEDVDHDLVGRLVDLVRDDGPLPEMVVLIPTRTSSRARPASGNTTMVSMWFMTADT
jgi:hypothetical protein